MGTYWTNPVRHPEDVGVGHIRRTVLLADATNPANTTNGVPIGALEAGAIPLAVFVTVPTAFNAGTTNTLDVGIAGTPAGLAPAANTLVGATGYKPNITAGALMGIPLTADQVIYAKYGQTGTVATAGAAQVVVTFVNRREVEGVPFPNNP
jgi:hypothetical protein